MPFATIDGQPLHYIDQGTGPAVLLAGSYLWDQAMWAPQIAALSQQYRVIALDLWGHGQSGPVPAGTTSLDDIARQALALLDHLGIAQVTLVGLSVGGMWGARLALSAPERINGLVLMDTYVGVEPEQTRNYYFSLFKMIEETGVIAPQLLDIVVPMGRITFGRDDLLPRLKELN
ncbi:MAG: alpha/beta fold hydrolase, partial [Pseudomonas prosekii]